MKGCKKLVFASGNQEKVGMAIFILEEIDFMSKVGRRYNDGHYIMIKGLIHQEDITT